ncbi:hypothetical protein [Actinoplanes xinjiangensis]|uniref:Peptidase inhibitor family I36 n=1 Tax=Actinoplanes xinjiangensis TaxID=512350 RepID=A0A316FHU7_9ACTN|nr:hypothetical protein [Actinoplanes xinjiangensis]PWK47685.1 hypothetical protein BC793_107295 [Actinoplanes xinjiangensis]GIF39385.1 hypothetical protein Axi01nite_36960 [Actinoplanes xinjiangensis]
MRNRTTVRALSIATLATGGLMVPVAAQAAPSNCWSRYWEGSSTQTGWQAGCNTTTRPGNDQWRAIAYCVRENNPSVRVTVYGGWVGGAGGVTSIARCASNYSPNSGTYQTRII